MSCNSIGRTDEESALFSTYLGQDCIFFRSWVATASC